MGARFCSVTCVAALLLAAGAALSAPAQGAAGPGAAGAALVVIDVQEDCTGSITKPPFLYQPGSDAFIEKINGLIRAASKSGIPILYLRTNFKMQDVSGAKLDKRLLVAGDAAILKDNFDAFASSDHAFEKRLASATSGGKKVQRLYLAGLDAMMCVLQTGRGAVHHGLAATVLLDAVETVTGKSPVEVSAAYKAAGIGTSTSAAFLASLR